MIVAFMNFDKPGHTELRAKLRPAHLEWIEKSGVNVLYGGPMLTDDGAAAIGSLIVAEFADLETARAFAKTDPYAQGGLFERMTAHPTRKVFPSA